ncbi:MAG TPA: HD domain-containing protein [Firmicutes bacterium]|nr:HD domain-containing protein [Bacillota bacterium]
MDSEQPVTLEVVKADREVQAYIRAVDNYLAAVGYTEHGSRHAGLVSHIAQNILTHLGYPAREGELAAIAGYLHDIGNLAGRPRHWQTGAVLVASILSRLGMPPEEVAAVVAAVGNHDEEGGEPTNAVGAALILADKSDVHRSRVRNRDPGTFDIHDRVNYAVTRSFLRVDPAARIIKLELTVDTEVSGVMDYFEIFLDRMLLCRRAARFLQCTFKLAFNGASIT